MTSMLVLGFLLGMRHALEADHIAAVASLTSRNLSLLNAIRQGAVWGVGHSLMLLLFGIVALNLNNTLPGALARGLEALVGIMLVVLGGDVLRRLIRDRVHLHVHRHEGGVWHFHVHAHAHDGNHASGKEHANSRHEHSHRPGFPLRALFIGMMHGMAGSAVLIVLTLETMTSVWTGILYIVLFGAGSITGMAVLSAIIAVPIRKTLSLDWLYNGLQALIGTLTIGLGVVTVVAYF